jgi:hypothetical protein
MKQKRKTYILIFLLVSCLFFSGSCGLDEYYVMDAPYVAYNIPSYSTTDYALKYFSFRTYESNMTEYTASDSSFRFLGTAVYYKIYKNYSTMASANSSISSLNSSTTYSSAAELMISDGYRQLGTSGGTITPLIAADGTDRTIIIRLTNYQSSSDFASKIYVAGSPLENDSGTTVVPMRVGNRYTFDFGRTSSSTYNAIPTSDDTDDDVSGSFSTNYDNIYFVDMYAVAVGRDTTYTTYYSHVLHLGAVPIDTTTEDN